MDAKKILGQLNVAKQCRSYGLSFWQCPQFLFLIMGLLIIITAVVTYAIGTHYIEDPQLVALIVILLAMVLFLMTVVITRSFERLAEANHMKSEFVNIVSHQLRAPVSNLKWAIELLMSGRLGTVEEKQVEYFKILKENISRMGQLVSDLLTVSRIETATLPFKNENFSFERLVGDIVAESVAFAKASNVEVFFKEPGELPKVFGDPFQIRLVITNLLGNAIRYIKNEGLVEITVEKRGNNLYFKIKDNGVGIPQKDQKHIFQKFFRSENALRRQTEGSGLGLYIAKAIVEKSGGEIGFESKENKETTFWFTLPISRTKK